MDGSTCFELRSITLSVLAAFSYKSRLGDVCVCGLQTSRSALSIASSGRHAFFPSYLARTKPALQRKLRGNSRLRWETRFRVQGFDSHNWDKPGEIFEQSRSNGSKLDSNQSSLEFGWCLLRATDLVVQGRGPRSGRGWQRISSKIAPPHATVAVLRLVSSDLFALCGRNRRSRSSMFTTAVTTPQVTAHTMSCGFFLYRDDGMTASIPTCVVFRSGRPERGPA